MKLGKNKEKEVKKNDDFLAEEAKEAAEQAEAYTLDIPDDEIWTYQIEGLQAPHINQPFKNAKRNKIIVVIVLLIAIGASMFFSVWAVHSNTYKYKELEDGTYELVKFSNPGDIREVTVDYVVDLKTGEKDTSKPISVINEYAFNCDETIRKINIGKDVKSIDGKSIYSCWWIRDVFVDDENPYYCDIDGVLYNKDVTEIIFYPTDHDKSIRLQKGFNVPTIKVDKKGKPVDKTEIMDGTTIDDYVKLDEDDKPLKDDDGNYVQADMITENTLFEDDGRIMEELWGTTKKYNEAYYQNYNRECRTYVVPSTVTKIGELAFAYANIVDLYIPEGVTELANMAIFKNSVMVNLYSYKTDIGVTDTSYKGIDNMSEIYASLPEGLEYMGNDCLYYTRGLEYLYIPASVNHIGHHALWDSVYKEDKQLKGITVVNMGAPDEKTFKANCETGDQWRAQYDYMAFKKSVDLNFAAERESRVAYNTHRQYYWAVEWIKSNRSDDEIEKSSYLVEDLDNNGDPELVLREYNKKTKKTTDTILTIRYGYLDEYNGEADYSSSTFSEIEDKAQLEAILE